MVDLKHGSYKVVLMLPPPSPWRRGLARVSVSAGPMAASDLHTLLLISLVLSVVFFLLWILLLPNEDLNLAFQC